MSLSDNGVFAARRRRAADFLAARDVALAVIEDTEGRRNPSLRYLTGHPEDALLFLFRSGEAVLVPWDVNLANRTANADRIIPYTDFGRLLPNAVAAILAESGLGAGTRLELGEATPHPVFSELQKTFRGFDLVCGNDGIDRRLREMRMVKDAAEIELLRKAAGIADGLTDRIEALLRSRGTMSEMDIALFLEKAALEAGAEGMGFGTIAAGPQRSWAIHAFPRYGSGPFGSDGMSILDFGVVVDGYTSDITITVLRGPLSDARQRLVDLVEEAMSLAFAASVPGASSRAVGLAVEEFFARNGCSMPHSLGHGIGLEAHELPYFKTSTAASDMPLPPGTVFTLEPGLYDPACGGVRLEHDVLMTNEGPEILTHSRIIRLR